MKVTPNFHMDGNCKEAIRLYEKAFQAKITAMICNTDVSITDQSEKPGEQNFVYHAEIMLGGQRIMMTDDTGKFPPKGNSLSLAITFDCDEAVKACFNILSEKGQIITPMQATEYSSCFVSFVDRYGIRWELMTETV